jgi:hypothetical protein
MLLGLKEALIKRAGVLLSQILYVLKSAFLKIIEILQNAQFISPGHTGM